jgi:BirA family biotin operon repressor/biotin-[acetyl-CoA-carboxylase] ligase
MSALSQASLEAAAKRVGHTSPVVYVYETTSTMHEARTLAAEGAVHGTVVVAGRQSQGRGRLQRVWSSPGGSLAMTVIARPPINVSDIGIVSLAAAVAIKRAIGTRFGIKWPNDVLGPDGQKVAGVLCELETAGRRVDVVLVGIGINVTEAPTDLPQAGCLADYLDHAVDVSSVAMATASAFLTEWREGAITIGHRVRVGGTEGVATGITTEGALIVGTDDGAALIVHAGDVLHVLP